MGYAAVPAAAAATLPVAVFFIDSTRKLFSFGVGAYYGGFGLLGVTTGVFNRPKAENNPPINSTPLKKRVVKILSPLHNPRLYSIAAGALFFSVGFFQLAYCVHTLTPLSLGLLGMVAYCASPPLLLAAFFFELCRQGARYQHAKENLAKAADEQAKKKAFMIKLSAAFSLASAFCYMAMAAFALFNPIGWYLFLILCVAFALKSLSVLVECVLYLQKMKSPA